MINEKDGRWFQFSKPSNRVNPYMDTSAPAPGCAKSAKAYKQATRPDTRVQAFGGTAPVIAVASKVQRRQLPAWATNALNSLRATTQLNPRSGIHPMVGASGAVIAGFTFLLLVAGTLSSVFFHSLPEAPIIAAVTSPEGGSNSDSTSTTSTTTGGFDDSASPEPPGAVDGVPANVMTMYTAAARTCGMPWEVLAAIGKVETNHGESNAPGVHSGANYAGAEGPMQFLPSTWQRYGIDADGDGKADIYDQTDAIYSAAHYLCSNGVGNVSQLSNAVWNYNHDSGYVSEVMSLAETYRINAYVLPVTADVAKTVDFSKPHHDYAADDIDMPVGTQIYAVRGGTVHVTSNSSCGNELQIKGTDGALYTYCHASSIDVSDGTTVDTGDPILHSGGAPGAPGAGDSTGPHLHLQITVGGTNVCPQTLLAAWENGQFASPASAPTTGCYY